MGLKSKKWTFGVKIHKSGLPTTRWIFRLLIMKFWSLPRRRFWPHAWRESPAITINAYGKGQAEYAAVPAQIELMQALLNHFYTALGMNKGPGTPQDVSARQVGGYTIYVNTTSSLQHVTIPAPGQGMLSGRSYKTNLLLEPYEVEVLKGMTGPNQFRRHE